MEHSDFAAVTAYESIRKFVKWSPPIFAPEADTPHDWQIFAGLAARLKGVTVADIEETYVRDSSRALAAEGRPEARNVPLEEARRLIGDEPGPDRIFDILIRGGPLGDAFGAVPDGLTLEKVKAYPHGLDLGRSMRHVDAGSATPDKRVDWRRPSWSPKSPACRRLLPNCRGRDRW